MRDDNRSRAGGAGPNEDVSADELLALLHKSVERDAKSAGGDKTVVDKKTAGKTPKKTAPLKIDDSTLDEARRELYKGEHDAGADDDIDVDELIRMYTKRPEKKKSRTEEPVPDKKTDAPENAAPAVNETNNDIPEDEPAGEYVVAGDKTDTKETEDTGSGAAYDTQNADEVPIPEEVAPWREDSDTDDDADMKVIDEGGAIAAGADKPERPESGTPSAVPAKSDGGETAIYDIKKVREAVDGNAEFSDTVNEALDNAATEIFETVHSDDKSDAASSDAGPDTTKVYGEPDPDEIDQTDLNLMIAFGMNDEIRDKVGEEKATELADNMAKKQEETVKLANIEQQYEYTSRSQNTEILTRYKNQYYTLIMRIIFAVILVGATFFLENYSMFGIELPSFMRPGSYPVVHSMIDLQFVVLGGALVYSQIFTGTKNLFTLKPTSESMTSFIVVVSALYTISACFLAPREGFRLFNLPVMLAVLLALICEFLNLKRDVFSFNIVSTKRKKFVVTPVSDATDSLEREIFSDYIPVDSEIIRVGRTDFVDGYFARTRDGRVARPIVGVLMLLVLMISAVFFFLSYFKDPDIYSALTNAFTAFTVTMPLTAFAIFSYPFYKASRDAYENDSAIIGEKSLGDYAGASVISFEDKEVFPSNGVKVTSIKVYGNNRIDEIIYNLASAFIKVGGPLADVLSQATHDIGHSENVVLEAVEDDGFTVTVDEMSVAVGKASYMEKQDFDPPYDAEDKRIEASAPVGILYIAYQGQLAGKVYVQYTIDSEFEKILEQLYKTGMCVGIKSFDPNIDDVLLAKKVKAMKYPVKVIRSKTVEDIPHTFERCDSGIVSKRSVKDLLRTVTLCERVNNAMKTATIVKILAMLLGVVAMVFVWVFASEIQLNSLYTAAYQLVWLIPVMLISHFMA